MPWQLLFYVAALVLFILGAIGVPSSPRFNLMSAGLACLTVALMLGNR